MPRSDPAAPPVDVTLPDGQQLRGQLFAKHETPDRRWLFLVGLVVWNTALDDKVEPAVYRTWVTAEHAHPIEGTDYSNVETTRQPPPAPPVVPPRLRPPTRWRLIRERKRSDTGFQWMTVHRHDCWNASGGEEINEQRAREVMAGPGGRGCTTCGTDQWFQLDR